MTKKRILVFCCIFLIEYFAIENYFYKYFCDSICYKIPFIQFTIKDVLEFPYPVHYEAYDKSKKYIKPPILLLGCSYTLGELLKPNEYISSRLADMTNRFVYNFGTSGHGIINTLALLKAEKQRHLISEKPSTIIYTYMFNHIERVGYWQFYNFLRQQNYIPFQKYNFLYRSYTYQYYQNVKLDQYYWNDQNYEKKLELFFNVLKDLKNECNILFPNAEFIVLLYSDINNDLCEGLWNSVNNQAERIQKQFDILYSNEFRKRIESLGIKVLSTEELIGRKMYKPEDRIPNDPNHPHPSTKAWDEILPQLIKKLDL